MANMQSPEHPLEVLPAMLNLVLLQTANILRDPECRNPKQAGHTKRRITGIVTVANQRYHDALDEIEIEILRAKAVMERDLRFIRKQRAEKDRANGILAEPSPKEADGTLAEDIVEQTDAMLVDSAGDQPEVSTIAREQPADLAAEGEKRTDAAGLESASPKAVTTEQGMPQDSENSMGLAITIPSDDTTETPERAKSLGKSAEQAGPAEAPIEIPDSVDPDFESMFNDTDPKALDEALNFDFELSTDPAMTQDILNDTSFNDIAMGNTDMTNLPASTNEDIDSLLPGVESYLNADIDFSNIAMPPVTTMPQTSLPAVVSTTGASVQNASEPAIAETSFDDNFFGLGNFEMGETGGDELGDGTLGDFEDFDWS